MDCNLFSHTVMTTTRILKCNYKAGFLATRMTDTQSKLIKNIQRETKNYEACCFFYGDGYAQRQGDDASITLSTSPVLENFLSMSSNISLYFSAAKRTGAVAKPWGKIIWRIFVDQYLSVIGRNSSKANSTKCQQRITTRNSMNHVIIGTLVSN